MTYPSTIEKNVFLGGISYQTGEEHDIEEIPELQADQEVLENLLALGLEKYAVSKQSPLQLARRCVEQTLEKTGVDRAEVGAVIFATTGLAVASKPWQPLRYGNELGELIIDLGLTRAFPLWVSLGECTNMSSALAVASDMVRAGRIRNAIVILADCVGPGYSRIVAPNITVLSDAAVSCLVSDSPSEYEIIGVHQYADWKMLKTDPYAQFTEFFRGTAAGVKTVAEQLMQTLGKKPEDFAALLINNAGLTVARIFSEQTGIPVNKIFIDNIARYAHCDAADNFINLHDYALKGTMKAGELYLLVASAPHQWGAAALRKT